VHGGEWRKPTNHPSSCVARIKEKQKQVKTTNHRRCASIIFASEEKKTRYSINASTIDDDIMESMYRHASNKDET